MRRLVRLLIVALAALVGLGALAFALFIATIRHPWGAGVLNRHWWLDASAAEPEWQALPEPPLAVHGVQGAAIGGHFYVVGGATRPGGQSFFAFTDATQVLDLEALR